MIGSIATKATSAAATPACRRRRGRRPSPHPPQKPAGSTSPDEDRVEPAAAERSAADEPDDQARALAASASAAGSAARSAMLVRLSIGHARRPDWLNVRCFGRIGNAAASLNQFLSLPRRYPASETGGPVGSPADGQKATVLTAAQVVLGRSRPAPAADRRAEPRSRSWRRSSASPASPPSRDGAALLRPRSRRRRRGRRRARGRGRRLRGPRHRDPRRRAPRATACAWTLAGQGLPAGGPAGYEILDGLSGFGTTSQMFDAAYWRAKEGELARTITGSPNVRAARVHLANPVSQPFSRTPAGSASVTVTMARGDARRAARPRRSATSSPRRSPASHPRRSR